MSDNETVQKYEKHCWTRYSESKLIELENKIFTGK